nr:hypothetical protein [Tanacetum cinerariifolium]
MWEDFVYQVEHKDIKKINELYYPRFTKVIIHHFMSKDPSIPRRNKVNWHYVRDDHMLTTIKLVSRHQNTQQFGAMVPIELTNANIKNSDAYKEYYADPSIPRRNKINWHYVRDDSKFSTIKVVSRHQNTQQYGVILPIELTNNEIRNTKAYKEYYAFATGKAVPKPKASTRRKRSGSDTSITPPTATTTPKLTADAKGKQRA